MAEGRITTLAAAPDAESPDGGAEIRYILSSPEGELTHAVCPAGSTSGTHLLPTLDEAYFVLGGAGEIWRASDDREAVTRLRPGRWVAMPAGMRFQYRANLGSSLVFLVVVLPQWRADLFQVVEGGRWTPGTGDSEPRTRDSERDDTWLAQDLSHTADYAAPDGSEIRLLGSFDRGGLCHCTLYPGGTSSPVRHRTVRELWFVTGGHGELWRSGEDGAESVVPLWPGVGVDITSGTAFQFRTTGAEALRIAILTMPRWPGASEALPVTDGRWTRSDPS